MGKDKDKIIDKLRQENYALAERVEMLEHRIAVLSERLAGNDR